MNWLSWSNFYIFIEYAQLGAAISTSVQPDYISTARGSSRVPYKSVVIGYFLLYADFNLD